jgi:hypothetical protein
MGPLSSILRACRRALAAGDCAGGLAFHAGSGSGAAAAAAALLSWGAGAPPPPSEPALAPQRLRGLEL